MWNNTAIGIKNVLHPCSGESDEKDQALFLVQLFKSISRYTWMNVKQLAGELLLSHSQVTILEDPAWGPLCRNSGEHIGASESEEYSCQFFSHRDTKGKVHVYFVSDLISLFHKKGDTLKILICRTATGQDFWDIRNNVANQICKKWLLIFKTLFG